MAISMFAIVVGLILRYIGRADGKPEVAMDRYVCSAGSLQGTEVLHEADLLASNISSTIIHLTYTVQYPAAMRSTAPVLFLQSESDHEDTLKQPGFDCFESSQINLNWCYYLSFAWLSLDALKCEFLQPNITCSEHNAVITCHGSIDRISSSSTRWNLTYGVRCEDIPSRLSPNSLLNVNYSINAIFHNATSCQPFDSLPLNLQSLGDTCRKYYENYTSTSIFGINPNVIKTDITFLFQLLSQLKSCYSPVEEAACRVFFPECTAERIVNLPCGRVCEDFSRACITDSLRFVCNGLLQHNSASDCLNMQVICPRPKISEYAYITTSDGEHSASTDYVAGTSIEIQCEEGYMPDSEASIMCQYSGVWSSRAPDCVRFTNSNSNAKKLVMILPAVFVFILVIVTVVIALIFREELHILCLTSSFGQKYKSLCHKNNYDTITDKVYDLYVCYCQASEEDCKFVYQNLLAKMEAPPHNYKLNLAERDFNPCAPDMDNFHAAIRASCGAIFIVSQKFAKSSCVYEFQMCCAERVRDEKFKCIVLFMDSYENLTQVPRLLKYFYKNNVCIDKDSWLWWKRIQVSVGPSLHNLKTNKNKIQLYQ